MIEGKQMPVLLDMGLNINMITPECVVALGLQMGPLTDLHEGGITINQPFNYKGRLIGYVIMSVQINGISGYNEDQWPKEKAECAHKLLMEYHEIFSLDNNELGCASQVKHNIKVTDDEPFKD